MSANPDSRFARQEALVPRDKLTDQSVTVIGVGAIGRQVALQLASIGVSKLQLIDFDTVEETNLCTQGYRSADLGTAKVIATTLAVEQIDRSIEIDMVLDRFRPTQTIGDVVFVCVDSISARAAIWRSLRTRVAALIDTRMSGETIRLLTWQRGQPRQAYDQSLFPQAEAHAGACTAKSTIYAASIAAGLAVHQFTRSLRGIEMDRDTIFNLLAGEYVLPQVTQPKVDSHLQLT